MHAEVCLRIKVPIRKHLGLTPEPESIGLIAVEQSHDSLLVVDICLLAHVGVLHLVDSSLKELFVLTDQEFPDRLKSAFALGD